MKPLFFMFACAFALPVSSFAMNPGITESEWLGFRRVDFVVEGRPALLILPEHPAPGNPWVWRAEWFGAKHGPQASLALLAKGWALGYMNAIDMYGGPQAMKLFDAYYRRVTSEFGLSKRTVMEGVSRGGLYAINFAAQFPDRVAALYLDAPTIDIESWPGRRHPGWQEMLDSYGVKDEPASIARINPLNRIEAIARAGIPVFAVAGDADEIVSYEKNIVVFIDRFRRAGGTIEVVIKPGGKHHPHSLEDPTPIVDFILQHARH